MALTVIGCGVTDSEPEEKLEEVEIQLDSNNYVLNAEGDEPINISASWERDGIEDSGKDNRVFRLKCYYYNLEGDEVDEKEKEKIEEVGGVGSGTKYLSLSCDAPTENQQMKITVYSDGAYDWKLTNYDITQKQLR